MLTNKQSAKRSERVVLTNKKVAALKPAKDKRASYDMLDALVPNLLVRVNAEYCVVQDGGKTRVLRFDLHEHVKDGCVVHRRLIPTYFGFGDFIIFTRTKRSGRVINRCRSVTGGPVTRGAALTKV